MTEIIAIAPLTVQQSRGGNNTDRRHICSTNDMPYREHEKGRAGAPGAAFEICEG
jgi:hypothetical protein